MSHARIRLLVVEDDKVDRMAFERMVKTERLPYDYTCASSLREATVALRAGNFDVVVTDYNLGDGSGFDLFPHAIASDTPIVLVTGAGGEETAVQAMKSGAADYLIKDPAGSYLKTLPLMVANTIRAKAVERELKSYHDQLKKSKETVEALLNATSDCAFLLKIDGSFVALNHQTAHFLGMHVADLVGQSYFDLIPPELAASRRAKFAAVVSTGQAVRFEDQGMDKYLDHSFHPVFGPDGKVDSVAVFSRDITEQKQRQEHSVQSQRLAALGEMAGGVAHNFNNVLQIIVGAAGLAEADLESGDLDEVRATLSQISDSAQFGSETVKQLQDFARVRTENPTAEGKIFDLSVTVGRAADVTRPFWKTGPEKRGIHILMKQDLTPDCLVKGKESELFEVIVNLIKNAAEAMPKGGTLLTKTYMRNGLTYLKVLDTGTGISKENLPKVFEPFWTSKGVQGTGMGLSTSFGIVSRHGGVISVKSTEGKGTAFSVKMPFAGESAHEHSSQPKLVSEPRFLSGSKGNVLVVDAEHIIGAVLEKGLRRWGYSVIESISGKGAAEILRRNRVKLIVTSMELPDMTGLELAASTKEVRKAGIPLILLSDPDLTLDDPHSMTDSGVDLVLDKPVKFPLLFSTVRELLEQGKARPAGSAQTATGTA